MTVYLRHDDVVDGPFDSVETAERWAWDNIGGDGFTAVTWAELTRMEIESNDLAAPEVDEPFYVRYPSGRTAGPFEDVLTADGWARDQGGPEARSYEVLDADEFATVAGSFNEVISVRIEVRGLSQDPAKGWNGEALEALMRALEIANGEGFFPYTFEVVG